MRLGISSYTYSWSVGVGGYLPSAPLTATDLLDRAADMGVHVVRIAANLPLHLLSDSELDDLAEHADRLNISIEVETSGIAHDHLRTYLELAERFGSPVLRVVTDMPDHKPSVDETVDIIGGIIPEFERANVCLAIENHDRFTSGTLRDILQRVGSDYVGICLDWYEYPF